MHYIMTNPKYIYLLQNDKKKTNFTGMSNKTEEIITMKKQKIIVLGNEKQIFIGMI